MGTTPAMSAEEWWQGGNKQVEGSPLSKSLSGLHTVRSLQTISSVVCPQVEKVSLHPDKQPKPKAPPAKQMPAKKELASGGSKDVRDTHTDYPSGIMVLVDTHPHFPVKFNPKLGVVKI